MPQNSPIILGMQINANIEFDPDFKRDNPFIVEYMLTEILGRLEGVVKEYYQGDYDTSITTNIPPKKPPKRGE